MALNVNTSLQGTDQWYVIERALNKGGMSTGAYIARDQTGNRVFIKALELDAIQELDAKLDLEACIKSEAEKLKQANLQRGTLLGGAFLGTRFTGGFPEYHDFFKINNSFFLVTELIDGICLEEQLQLNARKTSGSLYTPEEVTNISLDILNTLNYLHNLKPPVVFWDLKPGNVLIDKKGRAIIIDFGISKNYTFEGQQTQNVHGSLGYFDLAQLEGLIDPRSDIKALGSLMFQLLTGEDPKHGQYGLRDQVRALKGNQTYDQDLLKIIETAIEVDRERRYQTATEMRDALINYEHDLLTNQNQNNSQNLNPNQAVSNQPQNKWYAGIVQSVNNFLRTPKVALSALGLLAFLFGGSEAYRWNEAYQIPESQLTFYLNFRENDNSLYDVVFREIGAAVPTRKAVKIISAAYGEKVFFSNYWGRTCPDNKCWFEGEDGKMRTRDEVTSSDAVPLTFKLNRYDRNLEEKRALIDPNGNQQIGK